jgi:hypothetical protein
MLIRLIISIFLFSPAVSWAATINVKAFDSDGNILNTRDFLRYVAPLSQAENGVAPEKSGLYLTDNNGMIADGSPWWDTSSEEPAWSWKNADRVQISLPWPIARDGFSTVTLDGGGKGYMDGQSILLNEEIALTAYKRLQASLSQRKSEKPPYTPSVKVRKMTDRAQDVMHRAHGAKEPRKRAQLFDKALSQISYAWQQALFERGRQIISDPKLGSRQRFGLSLDETLIDRMREFPKIADDIADSGATWVRLVFDANLRDFTYSKKNSFSGYDQFVGLLEERKIRVMGSVLDSMLWPKNITPDAYHDRARNLALHYKDRIRSWEIASEPNTHWIGGAKTTLKKEDVLLTVQKGVVAIKGVDKTLETVATLHWWEGTAARPEHALFTWLDWATPRGFGRGIDVIGLSIYPHRHPMGLAFDSVFSQLYRRFPDKQLMLGGYSYGDGAELQGYWWFDPRNLKASRKDLMVLYLGIASAIPNGVAGGFYWPTLRLMIPPDKKPTSVYAVYKRNLNRLKK